MRTEKQHTGNQKLPAMLHFLQECTLLDQFIEEAECDDRAEFSKERQLSLLPDGTPQYSALTKRPPTPCITPGKLVPGGYTPSGKYKNSSFTKSKQDKRVGS